MLRSITLRVAVLTIALVCTWTGTATAGSIATGQIRQGSIEASVDSQSATPVAQGSNGQPPKEECISKPVDPHVDGIFRMGPNGELQPLYDDQHKQSDGNWYHNSCWVGTRRVSYQMVWIANVDPTDLAKQALDSAQLPTPVIAITRTPPAIGIVNLPFWMWIDKTAWKPVTASASANGLTATVTAHPKQVVWDSGDGRVQGADRTKTCTGPGMPYNDGFPDDWQHSDCTYLYQHTSGYEPNIAFTLTATLQWHVTWTATNGTNGDLGTVSRASTMPVKIGEVQALNYYPHGGP